jgi:hypothetical protein
MDNKFLLASMKTQISYQDPPSEILFRKLAITFTIEKIDR